jgi:H+-translocating NAD(P) transhydrogenase
MPTYMPSLWAYRAILGMVGIGGLFVMGGGYLPGTTSQALGALSVLLASVNVAGGFVITKRMLDMFKSNDSLQFPLLHSDSVV